MSVRAIRESLIEKDCTQEQADDSLERLARSIDFEISIRDAISDAFKKDILQQKFAEVADGSRDFLDILLIERKLRIGSFYPQDRFLPSNMAAVYQDANDSLSSTRLFGSIRLVRSFLDTYDKYIFKHSIRVFKKDFSSNGIQVQQQASPVKAFFQRLFGESDHDLGTGPDLSFENPHLLRAKERSEYCTKFMDDLEKAITQLKGLQYQGGQLPEVVSSAVTNLESTFKRYSEVKVKNPSGLFDERLPFDEVRGLNESIGPSFSRTSLVASSSDTVTKIDNKLRLITTGIESRARMQDSITSGLTSLSNCP